MALPVQAVYGQRRVFMIEDGLLAGIDVERVGEMTTERGDLRLLVRGPGLNDGGRVLTTQLSNAVTGLRVSVADDAQGTVAGETPGARTVHCLLKRAPPTETRSALASAATHDSWTD